MTPATGERVIEVDGLVKRYGTTVAGINGRAIDFLKLGLIFAHERRIAGCHVVPGAWVAEATRVDATTDSAQRYLYFWWVFPDHDAAASAVCR